MAEADDRVRVTHKRSLVDAATGKRHVHMSLELEPKADYPPLREYQLVAMKNAPEQFSPTDALVRDLAITALYWFDRAQVSSGYDSPAVRIWMWWNALRRNP